MKNMIELIIDDEKIRREGRYDVQNIHNAVDDVLIRQAGMVKDGNFYIEYDPSTPLGIGMPCISFLVGKEWFRACVKEFRWYQDIHEYGNGNDYHVEDIMEEVINDWETDRCRDGLPINR